MPPLPRKARLYWLVVVGAALACCALLIPQFRFTRESTIIWMVLGALGLLSEVYEVEIIARRAMSAAMTVCLGAVYIGGPSLGVLTVLVATLAAEFVLRWDKLSQGFTQFITYVGFNLGQLLISVAIAGVVYQATGGHPPPYTTWRDFVPPALAFVAYVVSNTTLVAGIVHLTGGARFFHQVRFVLRHLHIQLATLGVLAILMALVYPLSPWYVLLVASPLIIVQISIRSYARLREQAREAFERIARVVGERDAYTGTHSEEVSSLAADLARALRLPDAQVEQLGAAARVHDLGKIAVPDSILLKPGKLSKEEWAVIKRHPVVGAELLRGLEIYEGITEIVRHEHEHWDGNGYPDGLAGERIPLGSRVLAVADVWNALTTDRPYRPAYAPEEARTILTEMAGKVLDPKLVVVFLANVA